jgi:hypothetical protein
MPKDKRIYITLHNGMPEHPKVEALSDGAFRLLVDLWCWCSRTESDGVVPESTWRKRGSPRTRKELYAAGLVEPHPGGHYMHDYLEHQRSQSEIRELREKRAKAGSVGGRSAASARASATANEQQSEWHIGSKDVAETETGIVAGFRRGA